RGGFDRKLDADQIVLYRDDWHRIVAATRTSTASPSQARDPVLGKTDAALATSVVEILRERNDTEGLAFHYHRIGNVDLRDKYIEELLSEDPDQRTLIGWRWRQGRLDEVPEEAITGFLDFLEEVDLTAHARFLFALRRFEEAARSYARVIIDAIDDGRTFTAAYYLREMA